MLFSSVGIQIRVQVLLYQFVSTTIQYPVGSALRPRGAAAGAGRRGPGRVTASHRLPDSTRHGLLPPSSASCGVSGVIGSMQRRCTPSAADAARCVGCVGLLPLSAAAAAARGPADVFHSECCTCAHPTTSDDGDRSAERPRRRRPLQSEKRHALTGKRRTRRQ